MPQLLAAQASQPVLRTSSSEVLVDFVARNKHGQIMRNLRPGDVQVYENGVLQPIQSFEFYDGHGAVPVLQKRAPGAAAKTSTSAIAPAAPPDVVALRNISVVSVVIADLDPRGRKLTADAMRQFVKTELTPNTYVGVFFLNGYSGLQMVQPYTNNAEEISRAVQWAVGTAQGFLRGPGKSLLPLNGFNGPTTGAGGAPLPGGPTGVGGPNPPTNQASAAAAALDSMMDTSLGNELQDVYQESIRFLLPLRDLAQAQGKVPGRKAILLFSAGMPVNQDTADLLQSVISVANRANVSFYAVDTSEYPSEGDLDRSNRLLSEAANASMSQQLTALGGDQTITPADTVLGEVAEEAIHADPRGNLRQLAERTGGELLPDTLDLRRPLERVMQDTRMHYELTYSPTDAAVDGTFRKIQVKVLRPGVEVFARSGYYAVPLINGREIYPFEMATLKAINTTPLPHQFDFDAAVLEFRPGPVSNQLAFAFQVPTHDLAVVKNRGAAGIHLDVTALIKDQQGHVAAKISKEFDYKVPAGKENLLERGTVSFTAPFQLTPGVYSLETAAVDRQDNKASVNRSVLVVDEEPGLAMSDVVVARRVDKIRGRANPLDPLQARGGTIIPQLSGTPRSAGAAMLVYAVAYPPSPVEGPVEATVEIDWEGRVVSKSPAITVPMQADGAASILARVPTGKLPPGQYDAQVGFQYHGQTVSKTTSFTVAAD